MRPLENPFTLLLPSDHRFFGQTYEHVKAAYSQISELVYYGRYAFSDLMQMPVNVRSFMYAKLEATIKRENEIKEQQASQSQQTGMVRRG